MKALFLNTFFKKNILLLYPFFLLSFFSGISYAEEKLRVLYILYKFPQFSETYVSEEIASLWDEYEIKIVSLGIENTPPQHYFPYTEVKHFPWDRANDDNFIKRLEPIINDFKPHVLHTHFMFMARLISKVAAAYNVPFTIRSHSFDILDHIAPNRADAYVGKFISQRLASWCQAANNEYCLRILCFPRFRDILINHGIAQEKLTDCWPVINYQRFYNPEKHKPTNRILGVGVAQPKKDYNSFIDLAAIMRNSGLEFNLYIGGLDEKKQPILDYNKKLGNPVKYIGTVEQEEMPTIYKTHDWLVYTSDTKINTVGLPLSIAEAQANGIGICWQELPHRREEQLEYLGGAGFLFKSIDEVPEIISKPYPEKMRIRGFENAKKCDVNMHKKLLTEVWDTLR